MKEKKTKAPLKRENSRGIAEAAIDLSRMAKDGTWEYVVRKSATRRQSYSADRRSYADDHLTALPRD